MEEIWKDIPGYESHYQVSSLGRIKRLERKSIWGVQKITLKEKTMTVRGYPYCYFCLGNGDGTITRKAVHHIVLESFGFNRKPRMVVNHKNGVRSDNRLENLEWVTQSENIKHSMEVLKTYTMGVKHKNNKFSEADITEIRRLYDENKTTKAEIAKRFKTNTSRIWKIGKRVTWKHL